MSLSPSRRGTVSQHPLLHSWPYMSHSVLSAPRWREARLLHVLEIELMGDLGVETAEFVIVIALMLALKSFAILRVKRVEAPLPRQE